MNRQRLFALVTILVLVAFVGGILLEAGSFSDRVDPLPPRPIG